MAKEPKETTGKSKLFTAFIDLPLLVTGVLTVTSFLASMWWIFELTCHFRLQYALVLAVVGVFTFVGNHLPRSVLAWSLFLAHVPWIAPFYFPLSPYSDFSQKTSTPIQIASVNVSDSNKEFSHIEDWVQQKSPDLLLLMEVDLDVLKDESNLDNQFSYRKTVSRAEQFGRTGRTDEYEYAGQFGMVLYSNQPVDDTRIIRPPDTTVSVLYADIVCGGEQVHVTCVHTPSPTGSHLARARNQVLTGVAERVASQSGPRIVVGDLNTTSYSPYFWAFLNRTGLRDTRKGWGVQPTWPVFSGTGLLRICLDHCLISDRFTVEYRGVGPDIGSDHLPILTELRLKDENSN